MLHLFVDVRRILYIRLYALLAFEFALSAASRSAIVSTGMADWGDAVAIGVCNNAGNYMRRQFSLPVALEAVAKATAYVAAPGTFKLLVNDRAASEQAVCTHKRLRCHAHRQQTSPPDWH